MEFIVKVDEGKEKMVKEILQSLGCEVAIKKNENQLKLKKTSPSLLFGKYPDFLKEIDLENYREQLWKRI
jgi:uncharacterized protein (DUF1499 family)